MGLRGHAAAGGAIACVLGSRTVDLCSIKDHCQGAAGIASHLPCSPAACLVHPPIADPKASAPSMDAGSHEDQVRGHLLLRYMAVAWCWRALQDVGCVPLRPRISYNAPADQFEAPG